MCKFRIFTVFTMFLATEEDICIPWNMFCVIKSIVFKIEILTSSFYFIAFGGSNLEDTFII